MPSSDEMIYLRKLKPKDQIWVYFDLENPIITSHLSPHKNRRDLDGAFNWIMSYMRDSDIYHPYGFYLPLQHHESSWLPQRRNFAERKHKLAVWLSSRCGQVHEERKVRLLYVYHLRQYMPIDIYGECAGSFHQPNLQVKGCPHDNGFLTAQCINLLKSYKFFFAFENAHCVDYITEKYWCTPLELGLVPVVLGGADYKALAIPGSYINALDFSSQKELVDYLLHLGTNDTEYSKYFEWRKWYKVGGCLKGTNLANHYP